MYNDSKTPPGTLFSKLEKSEEKPEERDPRIKEESPKPSTETSNNEQGSDAPQGSSRREPVMVH